MLRRCAEQGVNAGYALGDEYPEFEDGLLVAITERRSREHIDRLAEVLGAAVAAERSGAGGDGMNGNSDAARPRRDDLRALGRGPPRGAAARGRRARQGRWTS